MQSQQGYKDPRAGLQLRNWMTQAGFVDVQEWVLSLPLCGWSNGSLSYPKIPYTTPRIVLIEIDLDPEQRVIGEGNRANVRQLLASLAMFPFTEGLEYVDTS